MQAIRKRFQSKYNNIHTKKAEFENVVCNMAAILPRPQGAVSVRKTVLPGMEIPMLKIRRPNGRLIFNMEIAIRR